MRVYSDGSDCDGGVGAAAVLYRRECARPRVLRYHLGPSDKHTVAEAEMVGTILAAHLLATERRPVERCSVALDNKPVVQASRRSTPGPGRYLTDIFHSGVQRAKNAHPGMKLTVRWVPGHSEIGGNERADEEAKRAAAGECSRREDLPVTLRRRTLPLSASKARQKHLQHLKAVAAGRWKASRRGARMRGIDASLPSKRFAELIAKLPRRQATLLFQLRTEHVPLFSHLERIGVVTTRSCPTCGEEAETVAHFLLRCPTYALARAIHLAPLGRDGRNLKTLLGDKKGLRPLFSFINATGRFRQSHGSLELADGNGQAEGEGDE